MSVRYRLYVFRFEQTTAVSWTRAKIATHTIAARDPFALPPFAIDLEEPPTLIGLFNQMKQEYTSARWMLHDGMRADEPHFSDKDVLLSFGLQYCPPYCRICKCYPDGAIADDDPMSIDRPRQMAFPACPTRGAVGGSGPT